MLDQILALSSMYAAKSKACQVLSFEPHYGGYYIQYRNIYGNNLQRMIFPFQISLGSGDAIGNNFQIADALSGRALSTHIVSSSNNFSLDKLSKEIKALKSARQNQMSQAALDKAAIMRTNICMTFDYFYRLINCR